jgi:phosphoenolpyruvate carboxykinase (ATP)
MLVSTIAPSEKPTGLGLGLTTNVHYQSTPGELVQDILRMGEGVLNSTGALVIKTGEFTGRSPKDKYIVEDSVTKGVVHWNEFNTPMSEEHFANVLTSMKGYLANLKEVWVRDCQACADRRFQMNIRVVAEQPWASLFAHNMFLRPDVSELETFEPSWHVYAMPCLSLETVKCGTRNPHAIVISFKQKMILIAGTGYTGEIKKGIFTVLNFLLPQFRSVLSMHCSANMGENGDTALFFGLSGTGKTTLSADPDRYLIGDDEHGWTRDGVFNFEGGCYAKVINLDPQQEPAIFSAIRTGALVENTAFYPGTNEIDYSSSSITENTRVSYPIHYIPNALQPSVGNAPANIFFLTCDAHGILPPIAKLNAAEAMYQFISGYTARIAGTESGVNEPVSTFSACFGAPFLPLHPGKYASMLGERIRQHSVKVWLVNTGWSGGPYGVGSRIKLKYTRNLISAALSGSYDKGPFTKDPTFGFDVPASCSGVPSELLCARNTWHDKAAYDKQARMLAIKFIENFRKYEDRVDENVKQASPRVDI